MEVEANTNHQEEEEMEDILKVDKDQQFQHMSWLLIIPATVVDSRVIILKIVLPTRMRHSIPIMERVYQKSICGKEISGSVHRSSSKTSHKTSGR